MKDTKKNEEQLIAELAESEEKYRIQVEMATIKIGTAIFPKMGIHPPPSI